MPSEDAMTQTTAAAAQADADDADDAYDMLGYESAQPMWMGMDLPSHEHLPHKLPVSERRSS
jgi:hypothetical protein